MDHTDYLHMIDTRAAVVERLDGLKTEQQRLQTALAHLRHEIYRETETLRALDEHMWEITG